ncbi:hypothetical protein QFC19_000739 [Naganishia cerealis]|uniref:Uncharacterized protein n=1 Tax=Naganishia cerealis TaxID=610337 RepID=A0ACC2WMD6_9TREE|nr:hypothetical protein QFC19_000739 [Naganishia cerealis]
MGITNSGTLSVLYTPRSFFSAGASDIDVARHPKKIDKFSQWTGERFFKEGKTELSSEFVEYEREINLRKKGIERLHATSIPYHSNISKKKPSADPHPDDGSNPKEQFFVGESLGLVMISHGQEMLRDHVGDRQYAERLEKFGRAKCKIAMVQDEYANRVGEGYISGMESALAVVQDYQTLRKKLDSRRLTLDAATRKLNTSKKDSRAMEEEVDTAQTRFDEIQEDTLARMATVQESEAALINDLTDLLEAELDFVKHYHEILEDLRTEWGSLGNSSSSSSRPRSKSTSAVSKAPLSRTVSVPKISSPLKRPALSARRYSTRSNDSEDEDKKKSSAVNRERSQSNVSTGSRTKSFMGAFGSFGKKDKGAAIPVDRRYPSMKKYGSLNDQEDAPIHSLPQAEGNLNDHSDDDESDTDGELSRFSTYGRDRSYSSTTKMNHRSAPAIRKPSKPPVVQDPVHAHQVRVLFEYSGKAMDELTIRNGDIVTVTKEVSPDWWIGENQHGESGLFPSAYTELYEGAAGDDGVDFGFDEEDSDDHHSLSESSNINVPPPLPSAERPRTLPPRASSAAAPTTVRNLPPPITGIDNSSHSNVQGNGYQSQKETGTARPALSDSSRLASSTSLSSQNKKPAPPPPTRRLTQTGTAISSAVSSSPSESPFEMPSEGNGMTGPRMVMPTGLGMPNSSTSRKGSHRGSPFGGTDDESGDSGNRQGPHTVADCSTCGCDE